MLTIIHGDDITASRTFLHSIREKVPDIQTYHASSLDITMLSQLLESDMLFESSKSIIIEDLLSGKRSDQDQALLDYIIDHHRENDIYLWEKKEVSKTLLTKIKESKHMLFKLPQPLFQFLESIRPNNRKAMVMLFQKVLQVSEPELVFYMLIRHIRILLAVKSDAGIEETKRLAPWQKTKLQKQAQLFTESHLITLYRQLFTLDHDQKTGKSAIPLSSSIDFLLLSL